MHELMFKAIIDGKPVEGFFSSIPDAFWYCASEIEDLEGYDMRSSLDVPRPHSFYLGHEIVICQYAPPLEEFSVWWFPIIALCSFVSGAAVVYFAK
jgi:hypothetical protein